jgi:hypothetical protein
MDDDQIGSMVALLSEPRTPPPDALDRLESAAVRARRRRRLARGATAIAVGAGVAAILSQGAPQLGQHAGPTSPPSGVEISSYGAGREFQVSFAVTYPMAVSLVGGTLTADGRTYEVSAYTAASADQTDDLTPPVSVKANETLYISAHVRPNCAGEPEPPTAELSLDVGSSATLTGTVEADPATVPSYLRQRAIWCSAPARADVYSTAHSPDRRTVTYTLDVTNTTDHQVEVVSGRFRAGGAVWQRASVTLDPGWTKKLAVTVTDYRRGDPMPWDEDRLVADGVPIAVRH